MGSTHCVSNECTYIETYLTLIVTLVVIIFEYRTFTLRYISNKAIIMSCKLCRIINLFSN